jgi:hypothetical protein
MRPSEEKTQYKDFQDLIHGRYLMGSLHRALQIQPKLGVVPVAAQESIKNPFFCFEVG